MELFYVLMIAAFALGVGKLLASGSEQETYAVLKSDPAAYMAACTAPPVEEKPWEPIYSDCSGSCGIGCLFSAGENTLSWYLFGAVLLSGIFGLHFYLG